MNQKLEIGKTEIVIYPKKDLIYKSLKCVNGSANQQFNSSNLQKELTAVYIGKAKIGEVLYEKYTLKTIPEELQDFLLYGEIGFKNLSGELNLVAGILQGEAEDGRKLEYVRNIQVEDVNDLLNVIIDFGNKKVYQKGRKDINLIRKFSHFGCSFNIYDNFIKRSQLEIIEKYINGVNIKSTAYSYSKKDLKVEEYLKELIFLSTPYYLNSIGVNASPRIQFNLSAFAYFGCGAVDIKSVFCGETSLFSSEGGKYSSNLSVRPVFLLKSKKQSNRETEEDDIKKILADCEVLNNRVKKRKREIAKKMQKLQKEEKQLIFLEQQLEKILKMDK